MQITAMKPTTMNAAAIRLTIPIRYDNDEVAEDFPGRSGKSITLTIDLDTKKVRDWPKGREESIYLKVCDEGSYWLLDESGEIIASIEEYYAPNPSVPGDYGDYVSLDVGADGTISGWRPTAPDVVESFFPEGQ